MWMMAFNLRDGTRAVIEFWLNVREADSIESGKHFGRFSESPPLREFLHDL